MDENSAAFHYELGRSDERIARRIIYAVQRNWCDCDWHSDTEALYDNRPAAQAYIDSALTKGRHFLEGEGYEIVEMEVDSEFKEPAK